MEEMVWMCSWCVKWKSSSVLWKCEAQRERKANWGRSNSAVRSNEISDQTGPHEWGPCIGFLCSPKCSLQLGVPALAGRRRAFMVSSGKKDWRPCTYRRWNYPLVTLRDEPFPICFIFSVRRMYEISKNYTYWDAAALVEFSASLSYYMIQNHTVRQLDFFSQHFVNKHDPQDFDFCSNKPHTLSCCHTFTRHHVAFSALVSWAPDIQVQYTRMQVLRAHT